MELKIAFQPDAIDAEQGWLVDSGRVYGERISGLEYGWSRDHETQLVASKQRSANSTGCQVLPGAIWEMKVDSGIYKFVVSVGNAKAATRNTINVENVNFVDSHSLGINEFLEIENKVWVTDGKLTIDVGPLLVNSTCINYITAELLEPRPLPQVCELRRFEDIPQLLQTLDGEKIESLEDWERKRKPEIIRLLQHYHWGYFPTRPPVKHEITHVAMDALGGKAICKTVQIEMLLPKGNWYPFSIQLYLPKSRKEKRPVILQVGSAPEDGFQPTFGTNNWNLIEYTIDQGYAYAAYDYGQIDGDNDDLEDGIHKAYSPFEPGDQQTRWATIAAWSWGASRVVDYLIMDEDIDNTKIIISGHSRAGQTAFLTAAMDERISLVNPHQSGLSAIRDEKWYHTHDFDEFYFWKNENHRLLYHNLDHLPFEMHCVFALIAPRPLLNTIGIYDTNEDYHSSYRMMTEASKVYKLYGVDGVVGASYGSFIPDNTYGKVFQFRLYHWHWLNAEYRQSLIDFADLHLNAIKRIPDGTYEAEEGILDHYREKSEYQGYTGRGYVELTGGQDELILKPASQGTGRRYVRLRYMCDGTQTITVRNNSRDSEETECELDGIGFGNNLWLEARFPLVMTTGTNELEIAKLSEKKLCIDHLRIESEIIYEAEDGILDGCRVESWFKGYTGRGFVAYFENRGDSITLKLDPGRGTRAVAIRYMCNKTLWAQQMCTKKISLVLNGETIVEEHALTGWNFGDHFWFQDPSITAEFKEGENTLRIIKANDGGELFIDHIAVSA